VNHPLVFLPEAEDEVTAALEWYEKRRAGLGVDFLAEIEIAARTIAEHPEAWPVWREGHPYRKRRMVRFPFVVFFRVADRRSGSSPSLTQSAGRDTGSTDDSPRRFPVSRRRAAARSRRRWCAAVSSFRR